MSTEIDCYELRGNSRHPSCERFFRSLARLLMRKMDAKDARIRWLLSLMFSFFVRKLSLLLS